MCFNLVCFPFILLLSCQRKSRKNSLNSRKPFKVLCDNSCLHNNSQAATLLPCWGHAGVVRHLCSLSLLLVEATKSEIFLFGRNKHSSTVRTAIQYINLPVLNFYFLKSFLIFVCILCMWVLCQHVCLCTCVQCLWRPEQDIKSSGSEVTGGY